MPLMSAMYLQQLVLVPVDGNDLGPATQNTAIAKAEVTNSTWHQKKHTEGLSEILFLAVNLQGYFIPLNLRVYLKYFLFAVNLQGYYTESSYYSSFLSSAYFQRQYQLTVEPLL